MPESFGNSLLGISIFVVLMWAWFEPQRAGEWGNEFEHGRTGSIAAD